MEKKWSWKGSCVWMGKRLGGKSSWMGRERRRGRKRNEHFQEFPLKSFWLGTTSEFEVMSVSIPVYMCIYTHICV